MPELLDRCLDDGRGVLRQCHVGGHRNCTPAGLLDNRARRFEALHAARREHEVCPRLGKRLGERHPQARGGPSHDRDLVVEAEAVKHRGHICPLVQGNSSGIGQNARTQPRELGLGCLHHHPAAVSRCCIAGDAKIDEISSSQSLRHHNGRQPPSRSELTVGGSDDLGGEVPGQRAAHEPAAWFAHTRSSSASLPVFWPLTVGSCSSPLPSGLLARVTIAGLVRRLHPET